MSNRELLLVVGGITRVWKKFGLGKKPSKFKIQAQFSYENDNKVIKTSLTSYSNDASNMEKCLNEMSEMGKVKNFLEDKNFNEIEEFMFDIKGIKVVYTKI